MIALSKTLNLSYMIDVALVFGALAVAKNEPLPITIILCTVLIMKALRRDPYADEKEGKKADTGKKKIVFELFPNDSLCYSCGERLGWKPVERDVGAWVGDCSLCNENAACTAVRDWKK